jgi:predicted RNA-binding protein YlxR (DUF448 family)
MTSDITDTDLAALKVAEETEYGPDKRGHKSRERRCVALGQVKDPAEMIRFVKGPSNQVVPDIAGKLPGRGVWVSADAELLNRAITSKAFARGFKSQVKVGDDLAVLTEAGLRRSVLGLLSMAKKSSKIAMGYDQVVGLAREGALGIRIEARDGAADGRGKIRTLSRAIARELEYADPPVIGCFSAYELGECFGRDKLVHAGIKRGKLGKRLQVETIRLSGFVPLIPSDWVDYAHEVKPKEE